MGQQVLQCSSGLTGGLETLQRARTERRHAQWSLTLVLFWFISNDTGRPDGLLESFCLFISVAITLPVVLCVTTLTMCSLRLRPRGTHALVFLPSQPNVQQHIFKPSWL